MNEILFFTTIVVEFIFILFAAFQKKEWLMVSIVVNLILIAVFGAKLVNFGGLTTNVGNAFFGSVFIATQILVERFGRKEGYRTVWIGFASILFFTIISQLIINVTSPGVASDALQVVFSATPRIAGASILAYLVSQSLNVWFYSFLRQRKENRLLWLRSAGATVVGQIVDSLLFFTLAFAGVLSSDMLLQSMAGGMLTKIIVGFWGIPVLYMSSYGRPVLTISESKLGNVANS